MKVFSLVAQILISLAFLGAGVMKIALPYDEVLLKMPWAEDFSPMMVKMIGLLQLLGVMGLNVPLLWKNLPVNISGVASGGLAGTMVGAVIVHITRGEAEMLLAPLVLLILSIIVTVQKFR